MKYYSNHVLLSFICRTTLLLLGAQQMLIHESETQLSSSSQKNNNRGKKKKKNVRGEENRCGGGWPNGIGNSPSRCHARHRRFGFTTSTLKLSPKPPLPSLPPSTVSFPKTTSLRSHPPKPKKLFPNLIFSIFSFFFHPKKTLYLTKETYFILELIRTRQLVLVRFEIEQFSSSSCCYLFNRLRVLML